MRLETFDGAAAPQLDRVAPIYADVYAEPPYLEGPDDLAWFMQDWPRRVAAPGFRLVLAFDGDKAIGMAFGHQLPEGSGWWTGLLEGGDADLVAEWPGRTFAVIELAVRAGWRRQGLGRQLHDRLLLGRAEERVTLLVRPEPEAEPARVLYERLGYRRVGALRPYEEAPVYDAMLRTLASG